MNWKIRNTIFLLGLVFFAFLLEQCKHDPLPPGPAPIPVDTTSTPSFSNCDPDTVYFENQVLPLLLSNCAFSGCHDAETANEGVVLINYNTVMISGDIEPGDPSEGDLMDVIQENDPDKIMPPPPNTPLTSAQIDLIFTWIQQGALNNGCDGCDTSNVSFSGSVRPIIQNKCQGCHSGGDPNGGISLTNYSQIFDRVSDGSLWGAINHNSGFVPMPYNGNQLPECEIQIIANWIADGAPDN